MISERVKRLVVVLQSASTAAGLSSEQREAVAYAAIVLGAMDGRYPEDVVAVLDHAEAAAVVDASGFITFLTET